MWKAYAACPHRNDDGFTLIEGLAAVTITALLVAMMFPIVAQGLGSLAGSQRALDSEDQLLRSTIALQDDLEDAIVLPLNDDSNPMQSRSIVFEGDNRSLVFPQVRISGADAWRPMLVAWTIDRLSSSQEALVRRSTPYEPGLRGADPHGFANQTAMIAGSYGIRLAYLSRDGEHYEKWSGQAEPPAAVLVEFGQPGTGQPSAYRLSLAVTARGTVRSGRPNESHNRN